MKKNYCVFCFHFCDIMMKKKVQFAVQATGKAYSIKSIMTYGKNSTCSLTATWDMKVINLYSVTL